MLKTTAIVTFYKVNIVTGLMQQRYTEWHGSNLDGLYGNLDDASQQMHIVNYCAKVSFAEFKILSR